MLEPFIEQATQGVDLTSDQMELAIRAMLQGSASDDEMGRLLLALRNKGEAVAELVGAARAMRQAMTAIRSTRSDLLDTCGTGGDGSQTFNISTAAAIVAAAAGAHVAKHGNRKITSVTGSADVLSELGIRVDAPREVVERCLEQLGVCFCFAPLLHPAMRHVSQVRKSLGVPTLFNYLGPLCNPAAAPFQLLGVGRDELQDKLGSAMTQLPVQAALVVRGLDGLDEISLSAPTRVLEIRAGKVFEKRWTAADFGLDEIDPRSLHASHPAESAAIIRAILAGERGGPRDIVLANAAAGGWLVGLESDLKTMVARCAAAIDSGQARQVLADLAKLSHFPDSMPPTRTSTP